MLGIRRYLEVQKITEQHVPGLSLETGYASEPFLTAFFLPQTHPTALGMTSSLPSHGDPSVFGPTAAADQQQYLYPKSSSYPYRANFNPDFSIGPSDFYETREANLGGQAKSHSQRIENESPGFQNPFLDISCGTQPDAQGTMHNAPLSNSSGLPTIFSAPQAIAWNQDHNSYHGSNSADPSTFNFYNTEAHYTAPSDDFDTREPFEYNLEPNSLEDLLESEVGAVSMRPMRMVRKGDPLRTLGED
jgi:hypothetical protein